MAEDSADPIARSIRGPDRTTSFFGGSVRVIVELATVALGRGVHHPGWQWSRHVGPLVDAGSQRHVGHILSARMCVKGRDGVEVHLGPKDVFEADAGHGPCRKTKNCAGWSRFGPCVLGHRRSRSGNGPRWVLPSSARYVNLLASAQSVSIRSHQREARQR